MASGRNLDAQLRTCGGNLWREKVECCTDVILKGYSVRGCSLDCTLVYGWVESQRKGQKVDSNMFRLFGNPYGGDQIFVAGFGNCANVPILKAPLGICKKCCICNCGGIIFWWWFNGENLIVSREETSLLLSILSLLDPSSDDSSARSDHQN